jgi:hypothetical protein
MAAPADQVFVVVLVEVAARSQGRQVHLVNGCAATVVAGMPSSVATASTACWATLRSTRLLLKRLQVRGTLAFELCLKACGTARIASLKARRYAATAPRF